jgi:NAD(P)-dependent dehydrogenase (short-subunit alcohol dehydrogenase family)
MAMVIVKTMPSIATESLHGSRDMKKILLVGAAGTIGRAVARNLGERHHVVTAGRASGEHRVDLTNDRSVAALLDAVGPLDAIVSTAGGLHLGPLAETSAEQFNVGLQGKLLGQVRLALLGQRFLNDGGSITLTASIDGIEPIRQGANASVVSAALEGFVLAAAIELPRGLRINVVSPTLLSESVDRFGALFPGAETVGADRVARAYQRSVEGAQPGRSYRVM